MKHEESDSFMCIDTNIFLFAKIWLKVFSCQCYTPSQIAAYEYILYIYLYIYSLPLYCFAVFVCSYFAVFVIGWQYDETTNTQKKNPLSELCNCWLDYPEMSMKIRKRVSWSEHMESNVNDNVMWFNFVFSI